MMPTFRLLAVNAALLLLYMTVWFWAAKRRKRLDTVDSAWGSGFMLAAWAVAIQVPRPQTLLLAAIVTMWSARLTLHIVERGSRHQEDPRYQELSQKWRGNFWRRAYLSIFLTQGLLIWAVSVPVVMAANEPVGGWRWLSLLGAGLWLLGFVCEALADRQLARFIRNPAHAGSVMDKGLWRYSRHPNYFGELLQWWAIEVIALQASFGWIGLLGPLLLTVLIVFVSGIPPIERRRRGNAAYQEYRRRTSMLIPWPPKRG